MTARGLRAMGGAMVLTVVVAACSGTPPPTPAALGAGEAACYRVEDNEAKRTLGLPWGVVLTGDTLADGSGRRVAAAVDGEGNRAGHPFSAWRVVAGDSLEVGAAIMGPLQLVLAVRGDTLEGRGRPTGDVVGPGGARVEGVGGVRAVRVICP